jgi:hypothetical protein
VAAVAVELCALEAPALAVFLPLGGLAAAECGGDGEVGPPLLVQRLQAEEVLLAFGKPLILIVLHFINNYYEIVLRSLPFTPGRISCFRAFSLHLSSVRNCGGTLGGCDGRSA